MLHILAGAVIGFYIALSAYAGLLLATDTSALAGSEGWVGTGLLGSVLAWLMFKHLPDKDAQVKAIIDGNCRSNEKIAETHGKHLTEQREDYKISLLSITAHCEREMAYVTERFSREMTDIKSQLATAIASSKPK